VVVLKPKTGKDYAGHFYVGLLKGKRRKRKIDKS
jgi:hypothetical protein